MNNNFLIWAIGTLMMQTQGTTSTEAPDFLFSIEQSWFHTFNLSLIRATTSMTTGVFIIGLVSSAVVAWVAAYAITELYNRWAKE